MNGYPPDKLFGIAAILAFIVALPIITAYWNEAWLDFLLAIGLVVCFAAIRISLILRRERRLP